MENSDGDLHMDPVVLYCNLGLPPTRRFMGNMSNWWSRYLPDYHELLHDSLTDYKLKGDELST